MRIRDEQLSRGGRGEGQRRIPLLGEGNNRPVIHRFEAFLPLITVDDWTGQDSLAEEFPLSGRNGIQPRILVEVQRFSGPRLFSDPLESYPLSP